MAQNNIFSTLLSPRSIAVIGASRSPQKVGHQVLKNIIDGGFKGKLYPVNPNSKSISGLVCYPSIHDIPGQIDLCLIVTPAPLIPTLIESCISKSVPAVVVISAGFAESGPQGALLQQNLTDLIQGSSVRLLGPNCLGCFSTYNQINATFGPTLPKKGPIMLISQSGALVTGILDWAKRFDLGLSHAVTLGNRIDISEIDALEYAAHDKNTKIILLYLESFHNAPALFSLASKITPHKPILLLKGGQSQAGQTASQSHTASLATDYTLVKSFANQVGIILTENIQTWLSTAYVLSVSPPFLNQRLGILTNAGGPGVLATDTAVNSGLSVVPFSPLTQRKLHKELATIAPHNPLDILGDAPPERFVSALSILSQESSLGSIIVIMTPQTTTQPLITARLITEAYPHPKIPILAVLLGGNQLQSARTIFEHHGYPTFTYPNEAITTLSTVSWYTNHKQHFCLFPAQKHTYVNTEAKNDFHKAFTKALSMEVALKFLTAYGFSLPRSRLVTDFDDIPAALNYVGRPAVLKTASMHLPHKAKAGGVYLGLMTTYHSRVAVHKLKRLYPEILFQQTIHSQLELILGCRRDPTLGPFITIGLGGSLTDAIGDRAYAFIPAQQTYLLSILKQTTAFKLIKEKGLPVNPVVDALSVLSTALLDFDEIEEIEINPAMLTARTLYACDIKITLR